METTTGPRSELMVWLPSPDRLRPGDIILTTGAGSEAAKERKLSGVIRAATGGRFSHALICSEPPAMIEAQPGGVTVLSLANCYAIERSNIRVLRYPDARVAREAARRAQIEVGREYSAAQAAQSIFPHATLKRIRDRGTFCSALVAQVYSDAGSVIFGRVPVDKTTPATIEALTELEDITDRIFAERPLPRNAARLVALDGDSPRRASERQAEISQRYAAQLLPAIEHIVADYPAAGLAVAASYFKILEFLMDAFAAAARIAAAERGAYLEAVAALDRDLERLIKSGDFDRMLDDIHAADDPGLQHLIEQSFSPDPDIDREALASFHASTIASLETRRRSVESILRANEGRSLSVMAYAAIETRAVESIARRRALLDEVVDRLR